MVLIPETTAVQTRLETQDTLESQHKLHRARLGSTLIMKKHNQKLVDAHVRHVHVLKNSE